MNHYKNRSLALFLLLFSTMNMQPSAYDIDEFDDFFDESGKCSIDKSSLKTCETGEAALWVAYLESLGIPELFNQEFYKHTETPNYRNIINYPNFFIFEPLAEQQLTSYVFYNQAFKKNYTHEVHQELASNKCWDETGQRLGSYLNIENDDILEFLETTIPKMSNALPSALDPLHLIDFPNVFKTMGNAHLEERRFGILFHYYKQFNPKTIFEMRMPILYEIHNLNFTAADKRELDNELSAFEKDPNFDETEFGRKHLVMDALGSGTLDITLQHLFYESPKSRLFAGLALYLPTDYRWISGLYGTYFNPVDEQPILDLCSLVNINTATLEPGARKELECYLLAALDHLSSDILQCPMGYNRHTAIAAKIVPYWQWKENLLYTGMYIFECILPLEQPRFFVDKAGPVPFSTQFAKTVGDEAKLTLIEERLTELLFPRVFTTLVFPGFVINTITNLQWTLRDWHYTIGYNWWYKTAEKLSHIQAQQSEIHQLDICKATGSSSSQVKLYAKIHKDFQREHHNISFAFFGNVTIYNYNLGDDFSIGISFDKAF